MKNELEKGSLTLFIFTMATNIVNYMFQIMAARVLPVESYGMLTAILSFILIMSVPGNAIRMIASKYTAECGEDSLPMLLTQMFVLTGAFSLAFLILGLALVPVWDYVLKTSGFLFPAMAVVTVSILFFQLGAVGLAQGLRRFLLMAGIGFIAALIKILGIFICLLPLFAQNRVAVLVVLLLLGNITASVGGYFLIKSKNGNVKLLPISAGIFKVKKFTAAFIGTAFALNLCQAAMMNVDILTVRYRFPGYTSGIYSSAAQFGKILIYAAITLGSALYPIVAKTKADQSPTKHLYWRTSLYTLACVAVFVIPVLLFSDLIVKLMFGPRYLESVPYIKYSCILAVTVIFNTLNMNYLMAVGRVKTLLISFIAGICACLLCAAVLNQNIISMLLGMSACLFIVYTVNVLDIALRGDTALETC